MVWRLLAIPLILSLLLLALGLSVASLGENKRQQYELIERQRVDILSLNVEKAFYRLRQKLDNRQALYEQTHSSAREYLENNPEHTLSELKDHLYEQVGFEVDIFLVDEDYVVRETTFLPDLGLDFKQPALADTQIVFKRAESADDIISGHPTQELTTGTYKLYTLSRLSTGGFMQLGFIDPLLAELFRSAKKALSNTTGVISADLFYQVDNSDFSTLNNVSILHPFTKDYTDNQGISIDEQTNKASALEKRHQLLARELEYFESVSPENRFQIPDPKDSDKSLVYLQLAVSPFATEMPLRYLVRVKIDTPERSWADLYGISLNGGIIFVIAALLVLAFLEIRFRIVSPLLNLKNALEVNKEIDVDSKRSLPHEIKFLMKSYNEYRSKNHELTSQLRHSAVTDPLTGLYNRSALNTIFEKLTAVARRNGHLLALAFIDLDHFKEYNDLYGHQLGDDALVALSNAIKKTFRRPTDAGIRFGGEEFLVFFDCGSFDEAMNQAKRLNSSLKKEAIEHEGNSASSLLTLSLGLAVVDPNIDNQIDNLIKIADEAVYEAKVKGRDNIVARNFADS